MGRCRQLVSQCVEFLVCENLAVPDPYLFPILGSICERQTLFAVKVQNITLTPLMSSATRDA